MKKQLVVPHGSHFVIATEIHNSLWSSNTIHESYKANRYMAINEYWKQ